MRWKEKFEVKPGRWVYVPTEETLKQGRALKNTLSCLFNAPDYYFHLRSGGHVAAAKAHIHNSYFLHLDITNFFGSISRNRVIRSLKRYFPYAEASEIARVSTVRPPSVEPKPHEIPYGFPQSAIIASMCFRDSALGNYIHELSEEVTVTVYMDDVIISCNDLHQLEEIREGFFEKAERSVFTVSSKTDTTISQEIEAFNLSISKGHIQITEEKLALLIAEIMISANQHQIDGISNYIKSVNLGQHAAVRSATGH